MKILEWINRPDGLKHLFSFYQDNLQSQADKAEQEVLRAYQKKRRHITGSW